MDMTKVLPDDCMSLIVSFTSPRDACRMALVSPAWKAIADSDAVWQMFLPSDYKEIVSKCSSPLLFLNNKDLYFSLCDRPILIDNETKSLQLEKENGKKCYMVGARALSIKCADNPDHWSWISLPDSRFSEVGKLKKVWMLDVKGKAELGNLSPKTNYAAYLVFKMARDRYGFRHTPVELVVAINEGRKGEMIMTRSVFLDPSPNAAQPQGAQDRSDGWMEIEMGEFFCECGDNRMVEFTLHQLHDTQPKRGLIIQGIELRPKHERSTQISRFDTTFGGRHLKFLVCKLTNSLRTTLR